MVHSLSAFCGHPQDAAGLLAHMCQVSYLHSRGLGLGWREFNVPLRRAREIAPAHRWGAMSASSPIWLSGAGTRTVTSEGGTPDVPFRGVCFQLNAVSCLRRSCPLYISTCLPLVPWSAQRRAVPAPRPRFWGGRPPRRTCRQQFELPR